MNRIIGLALLTVALIAAEAAAQSLWGEDPEWNAHSLYGDFRAFRVGDMVTVNVSENARARAQGNNSREKDVNVGGTVNGQTSPQANDRADDHFFHRLARKLPLFNATVTGKSSIERTSNTQNRNDLTLSIAARIVNVLPDGNLVLKGMKSMVVNNDRVEMVFSGIARPVDISADNTISSSKIADAHMVYTTGFTVNSEKKRSVLDKVFGPIMDVIF